MEFYITWALVLCLFYFGYGEAFKEANDATDRLCKTIERFFELRKNGWLEKEEEKPIQEKKVLFFNYGHAQYLRNKESIKDNV